jgi:hypothetical protein
MLNEHGRDGAYDLVLVGDHLLRSFCRGETFGVVVLV